MEEDHEFRSDPNSANKFSRENPKRSWRGNVNVHHHHHQDKLMVCRQCGKGFQSLKALCGHSDNCSSIDQEQEELALCLMMLSRETGKWVNISSNSTRVVDSSSFHSDSENSDSGYFMNETDSLMEEVAIKNKKIKEAPLSKPMKTKKKKKKKGHVCPICHKVYKSGQALGGHKRSHFLVSSEERNHHVSKTRNHFLDLNLPPPMDE